MLRAHVDGAQLCVRVAVLHACMTTQPLSALDTSKAKKTTQHPYHITSTTQSMIKHNSAPSSYPWNNIDQSRMADPNLSPIWWDSVPDKPTPEYEALTQLLYDGTPLEIAENFREQGNEALKRGKVSLYWYTLYIICLICSEILCRCCCFLHKSHRAERYRPWKGFHILLK